MSQHKHHGERRTDGDDFAGKKKRNIWLYIGVGVLIVLLLLWMTMASFWEDTDVAAMIAPLL